jgi:GAF domain-containing protein
MTDHASPAGKLSPPVKYLLLGVLFGLLFPVVSIGWMLAQTRAAPTLAGVGQLHYAQPLLWVIDTAPLFLGIFAYIAGLRQAQVLRLNQEIESRFEDRGLALNALENVRTEQQERIGRHLAQLNLAAQVAREAASIHDMDKLLDETTRLISDQFGFYHVGIFLISPEGKFAVLKAANSEGGQRMLERGHQLEVGKTGIVGYVTGSGVARIALDVGEDATFFDNPDLPETRSEIALPLVVRAQVIGALDVQSKQANAFNDEDVRILQTLADQIGLAIDNANLLAESNQALQELQGLYTQQIHKTWEEQAAGHRLAFSLKSHRIQPMKSAVDLGESEDPLQVQIPIRLRGVHLGRLVLKRDENAGPWSEEERNLLAQASEQVALALENARLYEEAQARALREQTINALTASLSRSLDVETLLRSAVAQLGEVPGIWEAAVHIQTPQPVKEDEPDQQVEQSQADHQSNGKEHPPGKGDVPGNGHLPGKNQPQKRDDG